MVQHLAVFSVVYERGIGGEWRWTIMRRGPASTFLAVDTDPGNESKRGTIITSGRGEIAEAIIRF